MIMLRETIRAIIAHMDESCMSPAAFFLGNDADRVTRVRIRDKGFKILEGRYDTLVYHPSYWCVLSQRRAGHMLEGFNNLPIHGLLEAGVQFPYSHLLIPISGESKVLLRRLLDIPRGKTFGGMLKEAMSRRDFLKKAAQVAAAGATAGPLGAAAKAAGGGAATVSAITSKGGASLGAWLTGELAYAMVKDTVYKGWEKAKEIAKQGDPNLSQGEINRLERFIQNAEPGDTPESWKILEPQLDALRAAVPQGKKDGHLIDKISKEVWEVKDPGYFERERKEEEEWARRERERAAEDKGERDIDPEEYEDPYDFDDYEGFDDLPYVDDDEDQPWMGENLTIPVPSLRHLSKAWLGGRDAWLKEIDRILG